ncbi:hypothetical protein QFZ79_000220 [Arthrobacter sp. V4I6]|nr:hypothetical protein [Arthrobacter sp. V1I7]MDQ0852109.1 hypothetical protein [Arthrobacter sp. V4I6]
MHRDTQAASLVTLATPTRPLDDHNWVHLNPDDRVIVKRSGLEPEHGTVDNVSEDVILLGLG